MLHQPDAVGIRVRDGIGRPMPGGGMTVRIRQIAGLPMIGRGVVNDDAGCVILNEIDQEMRVVNRLAGIVQKDEIMRGGRHGAGLPKVSEASLVIFNQGKRPPWLHNQFALKVLAAIFNLFMRLIFNFTASHPVFKKYFTLNSSAGRKEVRET